MARYRLKTETVEAEPYIVGMEDGWVAVSEDDTVQFVSSSEAQTQAWFDRYDYTAEAVLPGIATARRWWLLREGDYVVTDEQGQRRVIRRGSFKEMYEPVDAAPELLEALEAAYHELRVRCGYKPGDACYNQINNAIAKAKA